MCNIYRSYDTFSPQRLDVSTAMAPERMTVDFLSPAGGSWITIMLQRKQSEKFDNKIRGVIRVKRVTIKVAEGGA